MQQVCKNQLHSWAGRPVGIQTQILIGKRDQFSDLDHTRVCVNACVEVLELNQLV